MESLPPDPPPRVVLKTIQCILCGGSQVYPGPRYETHLINDHYATHNLDLVIELTFNEARQAKNGKSPSLVNGNGVCEENGDSANKKAKLTDLTIPVKSEDVTPKLEKSEEDFESQKKSFPEKKMYPEGSFLCHCHFCNMTFRHEYKLRLHLLQNHKTESTSEKIKAKALLLQAKYDQCVHKCSVCTAKFRSSGRLEKHVLIAHCMRRSSYVERYGNSRMVFKRFKCMLCDKEMTHSKFIIDNHLKNIHLISPEGYKNIIVKLKIGDSVDNYPTIKPKPFACGICGTKAKSKRGHLRKKHKMTVKYYREFVGKINLTKKPKCKLEVCQICQKKCSDMKKHLTETHEIPEKWLSKFIANATDERKKGDNPEPAENNSQKTSTSELNKPIASSEANLSSSTSTPKKSESHESNLMSPKIVLSRIDTDQQRQVNQKEQNPSEPHVKPVGEGQSPIPGSQPLENGEPPKPCRADIEDKNNTSCSSCSITFDLRRTFIEHCTIFHDMKFKTKSGKKITKERMRQNALKREADEKARIGNSILAKRLATENLITGIKHPIEKKKLAFILPKATPVPAAVLATIAPLPSTSKKILYSHPGVSKWNQCKYQCSFCKWTSMSRSSMTSHLHNTHGITIQEYKKANYPDIEIETNWFQCRLCHARTKFVKDCIAPHLKLSHQQDIDTYEREYMQPEDWPYLVVSDGGLRSEMNGKFNESDPNLQNSQFMSESNSMDSSSDHQDLLITSFRSTANTSGDVIDERDKWNRCRFQCGLCNRVTIDSRQMRIHITSVHGMRHEDYIREYGSTEIVSKKFRCEICTSEMKFCRQNIYAHLKEVHKCSLSDYESNFGVPPNDGDLSDLAADHDMDDIAAHDQDENQWHNQADNGFAQPVILDDGRKPSRWNKCRFRCDICNKVSSEKRHIREHIIKVHGLSLNDYESQYGVCEIHTAYFSCALCQSQVKHNLKNIQLHLQNVHNVSSRQYEEQFGRVPDEEIPIPEWNPVDMISYDSSHLMIEEDENEEVGVEEDVCIDDLDPKDLLNSKPPIDEIVDQKNTFCSVCSSTFTERWAYLVHCKVVHSMKARILCTVPSHMPSIPIPAARVSPVKREAHLPDPPSSSGGFACEFCGKIYSSRSNRTRHLMLSCDKKRETMAPTPSPIVRKTSTPVQKVTKKERYDVISDVTPKKAPRQAVKCPYPECDVVHQRSAMMKRHLVDDHNVQNVLAEMPDFLSETCIKIEVNQEEPGNEMELEGEPVFESQSAESNDESNDKRKVPPIRLSLKMNSPDASLAESATNDKKGKKLNCQKCLNYTTTDSNALSKHDKSCKKKPSRCEEEEPPVAVEVNFSQEDGDD